MDIVLFYFILLIIAMAYSLDLVAISISLHSLTFLLLFYCVLQSNTD